MSARRFGRGDKVYVVIAATVQGYGENRYRDEPSLPTIQVEIADPQLGGGYYVNVPVEWVQVHPADEVTTEYGARIGRRSSIPFPFTGKAEQDEYIAHVPEGLRAHVSRLSRPVFPWTESDR